MNIISKLTLWAIIGVINLTALLILPNWHWMVYLQLIYYSWFYYSYLSDHDEKEENERLKELLSADMKHWLFHNQKDLKDKTRYLQRCIILYRSQKAQNNDIVPGSEK